MTTTRTKTATLSGTALALCLGLAAGGYATTAAAQDAAPPAAAQDAATPAAPAEQDQPAEVETVTVTARKVSENLQKTPVAVSAISGERLEKQSLTRLEDLSTVTPNLLLTSSSASGAGALVYVRGVGSNSSSLYADSPVAVYIDGVLLPHGAGLSFDLPDIASVEVLRGPQGTLFGRNTTGGAVNVFTTKPTVDAGGSLVLSYSTDNGFIAKTVLNSGELGDTGLRLKATYSHDGIDGFARAPGVDRSKWPGFRNSDSGSLEALWVVTPQLTADYRFDASRVTQRGYAQFQYMAATPTAYYGNSPANGGAPLLVSPDYLGVEYLDPRLPPNMVESFGHALTLDYDLSDAANFKSITAYRHLVQHLFPQFTGSAGLLGPVLNPAVPGQPVEIVGPFINVGQYGYQHQFSEELQLSGKRDDFTYVVGAYYFNEEIDDSLPSDVTFVLSPVSALQIHKKRTYNIKIETVAAFGQASYKPAALDDKLELTVGVRYTRDDKKFFEFDTASSPPSPLSQTLNNNWSNVSGVVSLSYQWTPTLMTYGRVSNGYKAGGYNPGSLQPAYNPEKAVSYELGMKSDWFEHRLRVNVDLFDTEYRDVQVSQFNGATGASQILNAAAARYRGGEIEAHAVLGALLIDASIGYVDPQYLHYYNVNGLGQLIDVADQTKVAGISKVTANIGFGYSFPTTPIGDFSVRVDYAYRSAQDSYTLLSQVAYAQLLPAEKLQELNGSVTLANIPLGSGAAHFQVDLYGRNLLDINRRTSVVDFGTSLGVASGYYDRGRLVGIRLKTTF